MISSTLRLTTNQRRTPRIRSASWDSPWHALEHPSQHRSVVGCSLLGYSSRLLVTLAYPAPLLYPPPSQARPQSLPLPHISPDHSCPLIPSAASAFVLRLLRSRPFLPRARKTVTDPVPSFMSPQQRIPASLPSLFSPLQGTGNLWRGTAVIKHSPWTSLLTHPILFSHPRCPPS